MNPYTSKDKIASYKNAVEKNAGGKFYTGDLKNTISNITNEIRETKATLLKTSKKTIITDYPEIIFIVLVIVFTTLIFIEKRVKI